MTEKEIFAIEFAEWLRENCYDMGEKWVYQEDDDIYTSSEMLDIFKEQKNEQ